MVDQIKIVLEGKALEKFHWIKQEIEEDEAKRVVDFVFNTAIELLKKTANGKTVEFSRAKFAKLGVSE